MATILLCGVDLFIRGKLEALLPDHRFITTDGIDAPDLVIVDVARVDPSDVADNFPDVPLLGGAFAVCAAPCIGTVLASILVLASSSGGILRAVVLLFAYSLGLGAAFVAAGIAFAHAMRAFRWVRSHYAALRVASGATLLVLGLLLFFGRDWWLRVALDELFTKIGLGSL